MALNMLDSIHTQQITSSIHDLSREVRGLRGEVSRLREKLGPQPEWLLFTIPAAMIVLAVALVIIAAARKDRTPHPGTARMEAQSALPEKPS